jgi:N-glycosylase/DNA lyase
MLNSYAVEKLEQSVIKVSQKLVKLNRSVDWFDYSEQTLWYELVSCILGSRVKFEHAQSAANQLLLSGLLEINNFTSNSGCHEPKIRALLSTPIYPSINYPRKKIKYRYYRLRASHICRTAKMIYESGHCIKDLLLSSTSSFIARERIVEMTVGIGMKQSSLFLRNIGFSNDLAILDVHVINYMNLIGLNLINYESIKSRKMYENTESKLRLYAKTMGLALANIDTAIWVVMRVFQKEFAR